MGVQGRDGVRAAPKLNSPLFTVGRQTSGQASIMPPIFSAPLPPPPPLLFCLFYLLKEEGSIVGKSYPRPHPYWPLSRCDLR